MAQYALVTWTWQQYQQGTYTHILHCVSLCRTCEKCRTLVLASDCQQFQFRASHCVQLICRSSTSPIEALTASFSCRTLQSLLAVVPQKPVMLHGTVSDNLDPQGIHRPEALLAVLQDVQLLLPLRLHAQDQHERSLYKVHDSSNPGRMCGESPHDLLGLRLGEGGLALSLGQQQLLSVARALLRKPAVVCLDEVSAHLSVAESSLIESVISARLRNITCVRISHDVDTLMTCNTVGILQCGQLIELGCPSELQNELLHTLGVHHESTE